MDFSYDQPETSVCNFTSPNSTHFSDYPIVIERFDDLYTPTLKTIILILIVIIFVVAILGNSLVLFVVLLSKISLIVSRKTSINILIANHAVVGICVVVMMVPIYHYSVANHSNWIGGHFMCKFIYFNQRVLTMVFAFTMVALSCYNCREVVSPLGEKPTKKVVALVCLVLWGVAGALASPFFIYTKQVFDSIVWKCTCYFSGPNEMVVDILFASVHQVEYFLPMIITFIVLAITWRYLCKSRGGNGGRGSGAGNNDDDVGEMLRKKEQTKMLTIIAILFAILHLPFKLVILANFLFGISDVIFYNRLLLYTYMMVFASYCVYPVVYLKMGSDYRGVVIRSWSRVSGVFGACCRNVDY